MHNQSTGPSQAPPSRTALSAAAWRKSSRSQGEGEDCVELARIHGALGVRDSKNPTGPALLLTASSARAFIGHIKDSDEL